MDRQTSRQGFPSRWRMVLLPVLSLALVLAACGKPVGTPCSIEGSGFTASHDCATKCLARWKLTCPGGNTVTPAICAGREGCSPGSCPAGQACYTFDDPFDERSYCVPDNVCGALPTTALMQWEQDSAAVAAASRAAMATRQAQRSGAISTKAEPVDENPGY